MSRRHRTRKRLPQQVADALDVWLLKNRNTNSESTARTIASKASKFLKTQVSTDQARMHVEALGLPYNRVDWSGTLPVQAARSRVVNTAESLAQDAWEDRESQDLMDEDNELGLAYMEIGRLKEGQEHMQRQIQDLCHQIGQLRKPALNISPLTA